MLSMLATTLLAALSFVGQHPVPVATIAPEVCQSQGVVFSAARTGPRITVVCSAGVVHHITDRARYR